MSKADDIRRAGNVLRALQPDIIAYRWEMHPSLDADDSYGTLYIVCPSGEEMETGEFSYESMTRHVMEALENVLCRQNHESFYHKMRDDQ